MIVDAPRCHDAYPGQTSAGISQLMTAVASTGPAATSSASRVGNGFALPTNRKGAVAEMTRKAAIARSGSR